MTAREKCIADAKAKSEALRRFVWLAILHAGFSEDEGYEVVQRVEFVRRWGGAGRLQQPHIVAGFFRGNRIFVGDPP